MAKVNKYQREADAAKAEAKADGTPQIKLSGQVTAKQASLAPTTARGLRRPTSGVKGKSNAFGSKAKLYAHLCREEVKAGRINTPQGTWRAPLDDTDRRAFAHMRAGYKLG